MHPLDPFSPESPMGPGGPGAPFPLNILYPLDPYPAAMLVCAVIALFLCARIWNGTKKILSRGVAFYLGLVFILSIFRFAEFVFASPQAKFGAFRIQWLGIAFIPCSFYIIAKALEKKPLAGLRLVLAFVPGSIVVLLVWMNHLLFFFWDSDVRFLPPFERSPAPGFWVFQAYVFVQMSVACFIMIRSTLRARGLSRRWMWRLVFILFLPTIANPLALLFMDQGSVFDPTPITSALAGLLMAVTLKNFDIFEAVPYAKGVLLESIDSPILIVDAEGYIIGSNEDARRISPAGEIVEGTRVGDLISGFSERIEAGDKQAWVHEGIDYLVSCYDTQRTSRYWRGKIFLFRDVSELAKAQREAEEARARAEAANAAKSAFIATVSHELRNPLNAIIGLVDLNLQANLPAQTRDDLEVVLSSGNVILGLVNDLLDLAKIEAGKMELEGADFDLHEKVRSVIRAFRPVASKKGLFLDLEIDDRTPRLVNGDSLRYGQVLMNLLSNAVKFTESGAIAVAVAPFEATSLPDGKDGRALGVVATVRDTGIGIAPEGIPLLFREFSQADSSISRRFGGTGLGLSICKKLVDLFGGAIEVSSTPGEGSVFSYTARFEPAAKAAADPSIPAAPSGGERLRVLVVDDDPVNAAVARRYLQRLGHESIIAQTGAEAVELAVRERPDLVLLDLGLPDMDGFEACRRILGESSTRPGGEIPVAAMTARTDSGLRAECAKAGMAGRLAKPIDPADLERLLELTAAKARELSPRAASSVPTLETASEPPVPPAEPMPPEAPLVDMPALLERTDGDAAFARELLGILVDESPVKLSALREAARERSVEALQKLAHALKGASLTLCALPLVAFAGKLESACIEAARSGAIRSDPSSFESIESMTVDLEGCYDRTVAAAAAILSRGG
jgi:signal transduction histidine kinase/CheY-like chemotaxis protein